MYDEPQDSARGDSVYDLGADGATAAAQGCGEGQDSGDGETYFQLPRQGSKESLRYQPLSSCLASRGNGPNATYTPIEALNPSSSRPLAPPSFGIARARCTAGYISVMGQAGDGDDAVRRMSQNPNVCETVESQAADDDNDNDATLPVADLIRNCSPTATATNTTTTASFPTLRRQDTARFYESDEDD
eukprot:m.235360 g.235360  ORF g.235360 m.235360 type:complete len:188 (-) comp22480_c1_seq1:41-604(-)